MNTIRITDDQKSYGTEAALEGWTAKLDEMLEAASQRDGGNVQKIVCRTVNERWTAIYHLTGNMTAYAITVADRGFLAVG